MNGSSAHRLAATLIAGDVRRGEPATMALVERHTQRLAPPERWTVFDLLPEAVQAEAWDSVQRDAERGRVDP